MCKLFGVSRSCYYHYLKEDIKLQELIKKAFVESYTYGTRRIKKELEVNYGLVLSRRKIGREMKKLHLNAHTNHYSQIYVFLLLHKSLNIHHENVFLQNKVYILYQHKIL